MTVPQGRQDGRRPRIAALAAACVMGAAAVALTTSPKHPGHDARAAAGGDVSDVHAAAAATRAFVGDYLTWLRGRGAPRRLRAASTALRERLAGDHVRPSRVARRRRPRIAELHSQLTGPRSGRSVARILDADTTFEVALELQLAASGWEVTDAQP